jgi:hypothetical protein
VRIQTAVNASLYTLPLCLRSDDDLGLIGGHITQPIQVSASLLNCIRSTARSRRRMKGMMQSRGKWFRRLIRKPRSDADVIIAQHLITKTAEGKRNALDAEASLSEGDDTSQRVCLQCQTDTMSILQKVDSARLNTASKQTNKQTVVTSRKGQDWEKREEERGMRRWQFHFSITIFPLPIPPPCIRGRNSRFSPWSATPEWLQSFPCRARC